MEAAIGFLVTGVEAVALTAMGLAAPALFFLVAGYAVKGRALFEDMARAFPATILNLSLLGFNAFFVAPLIGLLSFWMHGFAETHGLRLVSPGTWTALPAPLVAFIAIFIGDFVGYWRHRLEHTRALWPSHAVHHSDETMTWLTLERFHPVNRLTTFAVDSGVLLLLGLPAYAVVANSLVRHYYGFFIHADLPWTYGRAGLVFVSPAMHRWHHAADSRFYDANFATVFSVFDRVFGTFRVPGPCDAPLGVSDAIAPTLSGQLTWMLRPRAYRRGGG